MAGKEGKSVGKIGRPSAEDKQRKITLEGKEGKEGKKIMFRLSEESVEKEEKRRITEVCRDMIGLELRTLEKERKKEREELRGLKERIKEHEERVDKIERRLEEITKWLKKKEEEKQRVKKDNNNSGSARGVWSVEKERESSSTRSEGGISIGSGLSTREVERIRRWVTEKDKEDRRRNIILKGIRLSKEAEKDRKKEAEWVKRLIREKLSVDTNVLGCKESETMLVVRLESEEEKIEVMRNKSRLKGDTIYIENDLSWEERNTQVKINKWAKEQKGKSLEVKIGMGRVRVKGIWRAWTDIERDGIEGKREEDRKGKERKTGVERDRMNGIFKDKPRGEKRGQKRRKKVGIEKEDRMKILFWNIARIGNKDRDWWKYIIGFDFISLSETWVDEKGWDIWKERLPGSHEWVCDFVVKNRNKGRAKGGFIIGKKKEGIINKCKLIARKREGVIRNGNK